MVGVDVFSAVIQLEGDGEGGRGGGRGGGREGCRVGHTYLQSHVRCDHPRAPVGRDGEDSVERDKYDGVEI